MEIGTAGVGGIGMSMVGKLGPDVPPTEVAEKGSNISNHALVNGPGFREKRLPLERIEDLK
jgi:hypothetical protein